MNEYNFNVKFEKGRISSNLKKLVQNDYNSTKINFTFDKEGRKLFKMLYPDGSAYISQIDNDELLFDVGVLSQDGTYEVEIALYTADGRLTDYATTKFDVRAELIQTDEIVELDDRLPILDSLIGDVQGAKTEIEDAIQYATEQGDYAKEQANRNFDAIEEATKIVDNFEENVNEYKEDFDNNAILKTNDFNSNVDEKTTIFDNHVINEIDAFNTNATTKLNEYNTNSSSKLEEFNTNATSKFDSYNTNATAKLEEYNTNANARLEEYNTNANARLNEYNSNADGLMTIAVDTRNELERVKNDILETGEASGNILILNDSTLAELQELEVNSTAKQFTTTGKNLLNTSKTLQEKTLQGLTFTPIYKDGSLMAIKINGTATYWTSFNIIGESFTLPAGTYIQSMHPEGSFTNGSVYIESGFGTSYLYNYNPNIFNENKTINKFEICINGNTVVNNLILHPMIEANDKITDFEPYTGGTASPNPEYPQEIPMITTDSVLKSVGKNLYNKDTDIADYVYTSSGVLAVSTWWNTSDWIRVFSNTIYSLTVKTTDTVNILVSEFDENKNFIQRLQFFSNFAFKYTSNANAKFVRISYKYDLGMYDLQLEKNDVATPYEPYQESILNMPIPEGEFVGYIDEQLKDSYRVGYNEEDGNYHLYLDKMLSKVVLNGSENITNNPNGTNSYNVDIGKLYKRNPNLVTLMCSHFKAVSYNNRTLNENNICFLDNNSTTYQLTFRNTTFTTVDEFKTWLSNNNVTVCYELANPYTLDLGIVDMPLSYDGTTNIFVNTDLLMNINATYYRNFTETVRNLQINNDTLKNELVNINNRLSNLEAAQASIVSESEVEE